MYLKNFTLPLFVIAVWATLSHAETVDYLQDIQPLLREKCAACHGVLKQEAGLRLDHGALARRGGDDGPVIDVKEPQKSKMLDRIATDDQSLRMPPLDEGEPLTKVQIQLLRDWIASGAVSPANESIPIGPDEHWAWQIPVRPALPSAETPAEWTRNPIDRLVYAKLREHDLRPLPKAEPRVRLRRLYVDLIGLPPTPQQQRHFLADNSDFAWERVVDRLLDDPAHGERWGRHWMDVWRYSDWDGYKQQIRGSQRHIWRWRDWIIESLNKDKGYDQMVIEMLAGDEVAPENDNVLRATGFLARNFHNSNRNIWLDATVEHTCKAFLATTINCARCHDHKYDPISQRDYYAFRAIFEPHHVRTTRLPDQPDTLKDGLVRAFDAEPDAATYLFLGGNEKRPDKQHPLQPGTPAALGPPLQVAAVELPQVAVFPALRSYIEQEELAAAEEELATARHRLTGDHEGDSDHPSSLDQLALQAAEAELSSLAARWAADKAKFGDSCDDPNKEQLQRAAVAAEHQAKIANAELALCQQRQAVLAAQEATESADQQAEIDKANQQLAEAQKARDALPDEPPGDASYTPVGKSYPNKSTGRRLALARWITRDENPLTARVAINYIWMHHFGQPLVGRVFDFGLQSPEPAHRELLDWLAVELIEHDWSMKHIHRLITTSHTYQLASSPAVATPSRSRADIDADWANNRQRDGDNRIFWRANVRRLDAEVVRDSLLFVAGNLDFAQGGPDIDHAQGETVPRRSLYFQHAYEKQMTMLVLFDAAAPQECYRRSPSIVPQQALALANSPLASDQARWLAARIVKACQVSPCNKTDNGSPKSQRSLDQTFIQAAFERLLCRTCSSAELAACTQFLATQSTLLSNPTQLTLLPGKTQGQRPPADDPGQRSRENLIHALMNHNDFITVR